MHLGVRADERGIAEAGGAGARDVDHRCGEVDAEYRPRGSAPSGCPGERTGAAPDVEDARAGRDPRGVEQRAVVALEHLLEQVGVNGPEPALGAVPRLFLRGVRGRHQMIGVRRVDAAVHGFPRLLTSGTLAATYPTIGPLGGIPLAIIGGSRGRRYPRSACGGFGEQPVEQVLHGQQPTSSLSSRTNVRWLRRSRIVRSAA